MIHKIERDNTGLMAPGQELVVAGWPGAAGTVLAVGAVRQELEAWFSTEYLEEILSGQFRIRMPGREHWQELGITDAEPMGEGGVLAAIWKLSGAYGLGVEFVLRDIPLRQETIEICERLDLNPYRFYAEGSSLLAAVNGGRLVKRLGDMGIPAAVIGTVTGGNARAVIHNGITGYLERPRRDELKNLYGRKTISGLEISADGLPADTKGPFYNP